MNHLAPLDLQLALPIVIYPEMDEAEFLEELQRMQFRSHLTEDFISGAIGVGDFLEYLAEDKVPVDDVLAVWDEGGSYLIL